MRTMCTLLFVVGMILTLSGSDVACFLGVLGFLFAAYAVPSFWNKKNIKRSRKWVAEDISTWGYCPHGRVGPFDPENIHSRCKGAGKEKCYKCILSFLHHEEW